ncbi:MAG: hypothetical protein AAFP87_09635 [Pseudomonadota bacterium]
MAVFETINCGSVSLTDSDFDRCGTILQAENVGSVQIDRLTVNGENADGDGSNSTHKPDRPRVSLPSALKNATALTTLAKSGLDLFGKGRGMGMW